MCYFSGCVCDYGWAGADCETDIDECSTGQVTCHLEHSTCVNVPGKAVCSCDTGFINSSGICKGTKRTLFIYIYVKIAVKIFI